MTVGKMRMQYETSATQNRQDLSNHSSSFTEDVPQGNCIHYFCLFILFYIYCVVTLVYRST